MTVGGHHDRKTDRAIVAGRLPCTCWCEAEVLNLPIEMVQRGLTATCGHRDCHAPKAA